MRTSYLKKSTLTSPPPLDHNYPRPLFKFQNTKTKMNKRMRNADVKPLMVMNVDIFSNVLEFCRPRERRVISTVSVDGNSIYKKNAERLSLHEMSALVRTRRGLWSLPVMDSKTVTWDQCLPGIAKGRTKQFIKYLMYQCRNMLKKKEEVSPDIDWYDDDEVWDDEHFARIMTLHGITEIMLAMDDVSQVNFDFPVGVVYRSLHEVSMEYCYGLLDSFFDYGEGNIVDLGMKITCGDGSHLPLSIIYY